MSDEIYSDYQLGMGLEGGCMGRCGLVKRRRKLWKGFRCIYSG